jgi:hypothetical protein
MLVPGLLQTEAYARATFSIRTPALDEEEIEHGVAARLACQVLLTRAPKPFLAFVIEEAVLRRPLGGRVVLKEQIVRLLACARTNYVTIQVMPTECEEHAGWPTQKAKEEAH